MKRSMLRSSFTVPALICTSLLLNACVLNEKYEAEKARSLNFQRLLAQEEKRTAELDNEVKRSKKELAEYEARNRELTAQVQAVREQMSRVQEEAEAIKEAALLDRKARSDMKRAAAPPPPKPTPPEPIPSATDLAAGSAPNGAAEDASAPPIQSESLTIPSRGGQNIHVVKPGETLYRISRKYGVRVETLRKWNKLPDDIIEVGQKLIISQE
ncbi:MAG TPA: LysM peptidoglycan-binding domain-containing protein [Nitrospira sp.]|nr:LysM peptidoglycan-binding domain-containing protein [Nitrospira sp.]